MNSLDNFIKEAEPYINTLVIDDLHTVVRLSGVTEDEDDCYWIFDSPTNGTYHASCVGDFVPLKGFIPQEKYERMVRIWNLNYTKKVI